MIELGPDDLVAVGMLARLASEIEHETLATPLKVTSRLSHEAMGLYLFPHSQQIKDLKNRWQQ
ncbi:MAG TPA: hypothetical protein VHB47_01130 [Thermoanaerobaculia bacterium]|nr:hypothetical protein [Thermoanaerobaculia bacterium]